MLSIARATLSWSFGRTHELEGARRAAERTARLAPDAVETLVALEYGLYYGLRDYDGALAQLQQARNVDPGNPAVLLPLGYVFRRQGKMVEAAAVFEQAFMLDPHRYETHYAHHWSNEESDHQRREETGASAVRHPDVDVPRWMRRR